LRPTRPTKTATGRHPPGAAAAESRDPGMTVPRLQDRLLAINPDQAA